MTLDLLTAISNEDVWLPSRKSARTRRAYRYDVEHLTRMVGVHSVDGLRRADHKAILSWEAHIGCSRLGGDLELLVTSCFSVSYARLNRIARLVAQQADHNILAVISTGRAFVLVCEMRFPV